LQKINSFWGVHPQTLWGFLPPGPRRILFPNSGYVPAKDKFVEATAA